MTATGRARRSDELYYDTQVTNRRALCDMIANLESDLEESKIENIRLRLRNTTMRELIETFGMIANDRVLDYFERDEMLETANATARELGVEVN